MSIGHRGYRIRGRPSVLEKLRSRGGGQFAAWFDPPPTPAGCPWVSGKQPRPISQPGKASSRALAGVDAVIHVAGVTKALRPPPITSPWQHPRHGNARTRAGGAVPSALVYIIA